ncbi:hypothetical protein F5Y17DRAFT_439820 [Xylariaceae sp. FL0594]|nr:hypothetical protein F5Y17DRAFT_439820 [Xylariaceae sp. FL0594]
MKEEIEYEALPAESDESHMPVLSRLTRRRHSRGRWSNALAFSLGCATTVCLGLLGLAISHGFAPVHSKTAAEIEAEEWNYCGRSSDEARRRGCVMEPMFYGWMPPQCVFRELSDTLPILDDRPYFQDYNMTKPVSPRELWDGVYPVVYTTRYHDEHCLFQWRKLHYAMTNRMEFVDNKTMSLHHAFHCADSITTSPEPVQGGKVPNYVALGFYRCRKLFW